MKRAARLQSRRIDDMHDTPKLWNFYTLPRRGHPDSREVGALELPEGYVLVAKRRQFEESPDPMLAVDLVVLCAEAGVYPPGSVVEWLADRLLAWHDKQGRVDLEVCLGIRREGKGNRTNPFEQAIMVRRDDMVCDAIARLRRLGASVDEAAHATWKRFKDGSWNVSPYKVRSLSKQSILDLWHRRGAKIWRHDVLKRGLDQWAESPASVKEFLGGFEHGDLPDKLRKVRK